MISATAAMDFLRTGTETEALLLEANLIKRLRPRFNVLLRDDKSFPYILIAEDHEAPAIMKHRGARKRKGTYFGPFASAGAVGRTVNALQKAFLIRSCSDSVYESRTRPCLLHQIKRCSAPCTGEIELDAYAALVGEAKGFLSGSSQTVKRELATAMEEASASLDFERAALYRDRLSALSHVQAHQGINPQSIEEADVFAIHQEGGTELHPGLLLPHRPELGKPRLFPEGRPQHGGRRRAGILPGPVLRRQAGAAPDPRLDGFPRARASGDRAVRAGSAPRRDRDPPARREEGSGGARARQCP